jgi:hypothetical protein
LKSNTESVFGTKAAVDQVLVTCGWQIDTSFIEQLNLSLRQRVAAMAAGLTDYVWSCKEVLLYRMPSWPQSQTV